MMIKELKLTGRKKLLGAVIICALMISGLMMWYARQVAEAAILDPHPGLVGWWRFNEGSGTVAKDSSGNGNDGTVYGATWADGKYGKGLSFDGENDYLEVPNNQILSLNNFTLACWVKHDTNAIHQQYLAKAQNYYLGFVWGHFECAFYDGSNWHAVGSSTVPEVGNWYFIVGVSDGINLKIYVNGTEEGSIETGSTPSTTTYSVIVGSNYDTRPMDGIIDEARIYNRALSQAEIQEVFQKMPDFSSKLLAKIPKGTTQVIMTSSWQGIGSLNATIESPSESYTEDMVPVYQKTSYSTSGGTSEMMNIKRLTISIPALSSDENWYITLDLDDVEEYKITVEIQK